VVAAVGEVQAAVKGGEARGKGVLLEALPEVLSHADAVLDLDADAVRAVEVLCLALKELAPDHPSLKGTIAGVQARMKRAAPTTAAA